MGLFEAHGSDKELQANGKWVDYGDYKILIAWAGSANPRFEDTMEKHTRPFRKYLESSNMVMPKDMKKKLEAAFRAAYAHSVVLDWEGVQRDGIPIPYSAKACKDIFDELPSFFKEIQEYATSLENYQAEVLEDDAKNS